jgi:Ca-activated chloride channel family protein
VTINSGIAITDVVQVFRNTEQRQLEALYTFPVPQGASVANFSMWIDGKEMVGEVLEKQRARQIYESYKRVRRDPGLLEQNNAQRFELYIFPIGPLALQKVRITYYQELSFDHDEATYVYPLATTTEKGLDSKVEGRFRFNLDVKSEVPLITMASPSHGDAVAFVTHSERYWQASLENRAADLNKDIVIHFQASRPRTGLDLIAHRARGDHGFFSLTVTAGEELAAQDVGMDYVFLLDVSGSMMYDSKLALSRDAIAGLVKQLRPSDRFELISFNVQPTALFKTLHAGGLNGQKKAEDYLNRQTARGGTVLQPAVQLAYRYGGPDRPLNVVILSDGLTDPGDREELLRLIKNRPAHARVFCIGVGNEVDRPLLTQMAEDSGGLAAFLSREEDFQRIASALNRKLLRPAASNVRVTFQGGDTYDIEPKQIPNLYHGSPVRIYGRYKGSGLTKIRLQAEINGRAYDQSVDVDLPSTDAGNPEIPRMWAWHRINQLLRDADRQGSRERVKPDIVRLGEEFSIVTEFTSFIVLENDGEYQRWKINRNNVQRLAREQQGQQAVQRDLERLRQQAIDRMQPTGTEPKQPAKGNDSSSPITVREPSQPGNNVSVPADRGGGAIDPFSALGILAATGAAAWASRKRKLSSSDEKSPVAGRTRATD